MLLLRGNKWAQLLAQATERKVELGSGHQKKEVAENSFFLWERKWQPGPWGRDRDKDC
jgi:hypothetical protein